MSVIISHPIEVVFSNPPDLNQVVAIGTAFFESASAVYADTLKMKTFKKLRKIMDQLGVEEDEVTLSASFTNDLGADSLDTVELIMECEKEFKLSIPDENAEKLTTVGKALTYIIKSTQAKEEKKKSM